MRTYHAQFAAPLAIRDLVFGDMIFLVLRVVSTSAVFLLVTSLFGAVHSWWALAVLPACGLLGVAIAAPVFAFAATVEGSTNYFAFLQRFIVIPMSLFAGVFYPVSSLPIGVQPLAWISPLWHGVEICRAATHADHGSLWALLGHVAYLRAVGDRRPVAGAAAIPSSALGLGDRRGRYRIFSRRVRPAGCRDAPIGRRHRAQRHRAAVGVLAAAVVRVLRAAALSAVDRHRSWASSSAGSRSVAARP